MIVEGDDDLKFIQNKFNNNTYGFESFSGCAGVEEIVNFFRVIKELSGYEIKTIAV